MAATPFATVVSSSPSRASACFTTLRSSQPSPASRSAESKQACGSANSPGGEDTPAAVAELPEEEPCSAAAFSTRIRARLSAAPRSREVNTSARLAGTGRSWARECSATNSTALNSRCACAPERNSTSISSPWQYTTCVCASGVVRVSAREEHERAFGPLRSTLKPRVALAGAPAPASGPAKDTPDKRRRQAAAACTGSSSVDAPAPPCAPSAATTAASPTANHSCSAWTPKEAHCAREPSERSEQDDTVQSNAPLTRTVLRGLTPTRSCQPWRPR